MINNIDTLMLRYKRFRLTYPSGTVIDAYYGDGVTLGSESDVPTGAG